MYDISNELSEREREIIRLLVTGASNKEIAKQLSISTNTVKVHLRNIFGKIGVSSRTEAAMFAIQAGIISASAPVDAPEKEEAAVSMRPSRSIWLMIVVFLALLILVIPLTLWLFPKFRSNPGIAQETTQAANAQRWQMLAPLPTPRSGLALASVANKIYAIGGRDSDGVSGTVEIFDIDAGTWNTAKEKPTPVEEIQAVVIGGKIYVPGGRLPSGDVTEKVEIYDPINDIWTDAANLPYAVSAYGLAAYEGNIYLFGGWNGNEFTDLCFIYEPAQDKWSQLPPMPTPRGYLGAAVSERTILLLGGFNGHEALATNEIFQPDLVGAGKSAWSKGKPLPEATYDMGTASIADIVYVLGGTGSKGKRYYVLALQKNTGEWQIIGVPFSGLGSSMGVTGLGVNIYAIGGLIDQSLADTNLVYQAVNVTSFPIIIK